MMQVLDLSKFGTDFASFVLFSVDVLQKFAQGRKNFERQQLAARMESRPAERLGAD